MDGRSTWNRAPRWLRRRYRRRTRQLRRCRRDAFRVPGALAPRLLAPGVPVMPRTVRTVHGRPRSACPPPHGCRGARARALRGRFTPGACPPRGEASRRLRAVDADRIGTGEGSPGPVREGRPSGRLTWNDGLWRPWGATPALTSGRRRCCEGPHGRHPEMAARRPPRSGATSPAERHCRSRPRPGRRATQTRERRRRSTWNGCAAPTGKPPCARHAARGCRTRDATRPRHRGTATTCSRSRRDRGAAPRGRGRASSRTAECAPAARDGHRRHDGWSGRDGPTGPTARPGRVRASAQNAPGATGTIGTIGAGCTAPDRHHRHDRRSQRDARHRHDRRTPTPLTAPEPTSTRPLATMRRAHLSTGNRSEPATAASHRARAGPCARPEPRALPPAARLRPHDPPEPSDATGRACMTASRRASTSCRSFTRERLL